MSSYNYSTSASLALVVGGTDFDYCDTEWFAVEANRDHSVVFDITLKIAFLALLLTMRTTTLLLRDSHLKYHLTCMTQSS